MTSHQKLILALEDPSGSACDDFVAWTRTLTATGHVDRAECERIDALAHQAHTAKSARFFAFASLWIDPSASADVLKGAPGRTTWFSVRERIAFDRSGRPDEARPWAGVKKTTPWAPVPGVDERIWQGRYANHGHVARAHHATCVRYRQNVVVESSDPLLRAVSELWWTNLDDLVERFYRSAEAELHVGIDASGFVDNAHAYPTVTRHETIRLGSVATPTHGFIR